MKTKEQIIDIIKSSLDSEFNEFFGLRFDGRDLPVGYWLENSKSNRDRDDAREFPEFGTEEYEEMEELDGTCCYDLFDGDSEKEYRFIDKVLNFYFEDDENRNWYIIASNSISDEEGEDNHEIILCDAKVIAKL